MPDTGKKSKWGLFHKDRPNANIDSTYGSDIGSSERDSYASNPSFTGSDNSQPISTFVNDQGQIVTTTTTTTTTTTSGGYSSQTTGPHTSNLANKLDPTVRSGADHTEVSETVPRYENDRPSIPQKSTMRPHSPNPAAPQTSGVPPMQTGINNNPTYGSPSSPSGRANFSYPGRIPPTGQAPLQGNQPSTLQNLKTAAIGIHGAGETLRGTLNQAIDKHGGANPAVLEKNSRVMEGGRQEIETGRLSDNSRAQGGINPKGILRKSGGHGQLRVVNE